MKDGARDAVRGTRENEETAHRVPPTAYAEGWHAALSEAWDAYCAGSYPIGACVVGADGAVVTRGRNRIGEEVFVNGVISGRRQAHAELNALLALPPLSPQENAALTLFTTVEPCPMCLGAMLMQKVGHLAYAAADLWAGHTGTLAEEGYANRRRLRVSRAPEAVARACEIWQIAFQMEKGMPLEHGYFEVHRQHKRDVYDRGEALFRAKTLPALRARRAPVAEALAVLGGEA